MPVDWESNADNYDPSNNNEPIMGRPPMALDMPLCKGMRMHLTRNVTYASHQKCEQGGRLCQRHGGDRRVLRLKLEVRSPGQQDRSAACGLLGESAWLLTG